MCDGWYLWLIAICVWQRERLLRRDGRTALCGAWFSWRCPQPPNNKIWLPVNPHHTNLSHIENTDFVVLCNSVQTGHRGKGRKTR